MRRSGPLGAVERRGSIRHRLRKRPAAERRFNAGGIADRALGTRDLPKIEAGPTDYSLLVAVILLLGLGIVMVFSASAVMAMTNFNDPFYFLKRQAVWALIGLLGMTVLMNFDYWHYKKLAPAIIVLSITLLVAVLLPGIGRISHGARRWIGFGPLTLTPSEPAKMAMVIYLAYLLSSKGYKIKTFFRGVLPPVLLGLGMFALILQQPDLGTGLTVMGSTFIMLFSAGAKIWHLLGLIGMGIPGVFAAIFMEEYRRERFLAFLDPWADPRGSGYHIIQSLYALGSGGPFGLGLGKSRQKFLYLPEMHTDFIFAIIGEELGFVGAMLVIILFFFFAWRGYRIAMNAPDGFSCLLSCGLTSMILIQALVNIGVVTGTLPITGIPLPFLSFGGSSLVFTLASVGILLNISRYCTG